MVHHDESCHEIGRNSVSRAPAIGANETPGLNIEIRMVGLRAKFLDKNENTETIRKNTEKYWFGPVRAFYNFCNHWLRFSMVLFGAM